MVGGQVCWPVRGLFQGIPGCSGCVRGYSEPVPSFTDTQKFELQILKCTQLGFFAVNIHVTNFEMHTARIFEVKIPFVYSEMHRIRIFAVKILVANFETRISAMKVRVANVNCKIYRCPLWATVVPIPKFIIFPFLSHTFHTEIVAKLV